MSDLNSLVESALAEASHIDKYFTSHKVENEEPISTAGGGGNSRKLDTAAQLKLSEDLSRRLFQKVRELEAALAAASAPLDSSRVAEVENEASLHGAWGTPGSYIAGSTDEATVKMLLSKVALLESATSKEKFHFLKSKLEAAQRSEKAASNEYTSLSSARSDSEVARALTVRLNRLAGEREQDSADFDTLLFQVEQRASDAYVQQKMAERELASCRAAQADKDEAQRTLQEQVASLEAEVARLRAPS